MKKKITAVFMSCVMSCVMADASGISVSAAEEKTFVYGTVGYGEAQGDAGLNPHDNYSGWSAPRYGVGETVCK